MNTRTILILFVVTVAVAVAAVQSMRSRESLTAAEDVSGASLVPDLVDRVNDVAAVAVTSTEGSFRLERGEQGWGAADKGGYPVDFERVKALVVGVAGFDIVEAKTSNPDYHAKLGVEDVEAQDSSSTRVTLEDQGGAVLADVLVGEPRVARGRGAANQGSQYARRADDPQCYEVKGRVRIDAVISNWLDKEIVRIEPERIRQVEIRHADGERLVVYKDSEDDENFSVQDLPAGRELMWAGVADSIAGAIAYLNLEDVGTAEMIDFDAQETTTAEFSTFDGLIVSVTTAEVDEKAYLKLSAIFDESARTPEAAPAETPPEEGEEPAQEEAEEEDPGKTREEVLEEASQINARGTMWTYVVPGYTAANLRKRMDELLKEVEELEVPEAEVPEAEVLEPVEVPDAEVPEPVEEEPAPEDG